MKIQLLLAIADTDYLEHLSQQLMERYGDTFAVQACSNFAKLDSIAIHQKVDIALMDEDIAGNVRTSSIRLPLILWDENNSCLNEELKRIKKYQRISAMVSQMLQLYSEVYSGSGTFGEGKAHITVIWSPAGGSGKTTVALSYAAQKVAKSKKTTYLNLEPFASTPVYFAQEEKSISAVLEKLDDNVELLLQSVRQTDTSSGISYYSRPSNYDDINILTEEDIVKLVNACAVGMDELIIDLGSVFDHKTNSLLEMADTVLLVDDGSKASRIKLEQFRLQHNVFERIASKCVLIANKGAKYINNELNCASLPMVQSADPVVVYKTLSAINID